ncbi:MAG: ABC transporter permease [Burkholderiales bacterium]|nr:ABC transporter permease [Burkholderiales bacterium]
MPAARRDRRAIPHSVSPGLWTLAWRRLRRDRLAMISLAIVLAFIAMVILSGLGLIARDWAREVAVNYAPPTFVGAEITAAPATSAALPSGTAASPPAPGHDWEAEVVDPLGDVIAELRGEAQPNPGVGTPAPPGGAGGRTREDTGFVDPLADVMQEIEAAKHAAKPPAPASRSRGATADPLADVMKDIEAERAAPGTGSGATGGRRATLPFGADKWGRDVIAKTIKGSETSIFVGLAAAFVATFIGTVLGAFAGYYGRWVDDALNWFYSIFSSIPYLLLILAVAAVLQHKGTMTIVLILGLTGWTGVFRLIRAEYLKHKGREYVQAANAIGASNARRMYRHIFPNVSHVVLVQLSILVVAFIKSEVILSFLGFGVPVDVVSWGSMLNEAQNELLLGKWWQLVAAGVSMALLVTAFSLFTDALRDALDPKLRGSEGN